MEKIKHFIKNETVLIVSFILAVGSAFIVPPNAEYVDYIDFKTLSLLFCLMAVMAGFGKLGLFDFLAKKLLSGVNSVRQLCFVLCLFCFFSAMVITNDVALITFVPFTVEALRLSGKKDKMILVITLETVAANLGSMLTPIGNPQNLYLFSAYEMSIKDFVLAVLPYAALSLVLVAVSAFFTGKDKTECLQSENTKFSPGMNGMVYTVLFALSLLTVFKVVPHDVALCATIASLVIFDRKVFAKVDYSLLLTFVFLFIFIGNLGKINAVNGREVVAGVAASQVFSNVPAAILLSGFTDNVKDLLIGVNLGGLGTLIASMASLISFKLIIKENVKTGRYLLVFTLVNIVFLAFNIALWLIIR